MFTKNESSPLELLGLKLSERVGWKFTSADATVSRLSEQEDLGTYPCVPAGEAEEKSDHEENRSTSSSSEIFLHAVPNNIVTECEFLNTHQRCCWARTYLDQSLSHLSPQLLCSYSEEQASVIYRICDIITKENKQVKKKPINRRVIVMKNALPSMIRYGTHSSPRYFISGHIDVQFRMEKKRDESDTTINEDASLGVPPDFLLMISDASCSSVFHYPRGASPTNSAGRQLLLLQEVNRVAGELFSATYTPFSWEISVVSNSSSVLLSAARKRERSYSGESNTSCFWPCFFVYGVYIAPNDEALGRLFTSLYSYQPSMTREARYGHEDSTHSTETQHRTIVNSNIVLQRKMKKIIEAINQLTLPDHLQMERTHSGHRFVFLGELKSSKFISAEKCENPNNGNLVSVLPSSSSFPLHLSIGELEKILQPTSSLEDIMEIIQQVWGKSS